MSEYIDNWRSVAAGWERQRSLFWESTHMYGSVLERTWAPCNTSVAGMPCVTSITRASGAIFAITP